MNHTSTIPHADVDVLLIGAGIMSATLAVLLKKLDPGITIAVFERLDRLAAESSDAWNNAGTGHSAFCELNYTPEREDGSIDISKALKIADSFEVSREFWAYLVQQDYVGDPRAFITPIPHMSFVWGAENVAYLKKRHEALLRSPLFEGMQFSDSPEQLREWMPLVMEARDPAQPVAATRMEIGTDVNFGALTRHLFRWLEQQEGVAVYLNREVRDIDREDDGAWKVRLKNLYTDEKEDVLSRFVFIGAGGGSLPLLEKANIPEADGYGGFPVGGQWLRCTNPDVIRRHQAKVYGKAAVGSPPMSVPHLDTRFINGKKALLFGPYAGFSTKFLKNGSWLDLPLSIKLDNIRPMLAAGIHNIPLTRYLIDQVRLSPEARMEALREFYPEARMEDWELEIAGQRVQVIKKDEEEGGVLEFGTEIVHSADGSIAALLGASPGASTSVSIMLDLLKRCFGERMQSAEWQEQLKAMIPSYGQSLHGDADLCAHTRAWTGKVLRLDTIGQIQ